MILLMPDPYVVKPQKKIFVRVMAGVMGSIPARGIHFHDACHRNHPCTEFGPSRISRSTENKTLVDKEGFL
jgi:hypothetical protein